MGGLRGSLALAAATVLGCASVPLTMSVPASPSPPIAAAQRPPIGAATSTSARRAPVAELTGPSWGSIYSRYFAPGTEGDCGRSRACHAETMADAASAYAWLAQWGYIAGAHSPLISPLNSCLRWFGGNMPPRGTANDEAIRDLAAWVAAGAPSGD